MLIGNMVTKLFNLFQKYIQRKYKYEVCIFAPFFSTSKFRLVNTYTSTDVKWLEMIT